MLTSGLHVPVHVCAPSTHAGVYTSNAQIVKMDTVSSFSWNMNIKYHMYLIVPISTIICQSECIYEVGVIAQWNACLVCGRP